MPGRYNLAEFPDLIRSQGGLVPLFMQTGVRLEESPLELFNMVMKANALAAELQLQLDAIAEACGYDPDEED